MKRLFDHALRMQFGLLFSLLLMLTLAMQTGFDSMGKPKSAEQKESSQQSALIKLKNKYPNHFVFGGPPNHKWIALTFDDAPDSRYTDRILDILKEHQVRATFFVVGYRSEKMPATVRRMAKEGHAIGNHTYNHPFLPNLSQLSFQQQIEKTQRILEQILGEPPSIFRPPYGAITEEQLTWLIDQQMIIVNWNVDSQDWRGISSKEVFDNIFTDIGPGAIVLQHAGGGVSEDLSGTIQALPQIIRSLKEEGYSFVTIPELLGGWPLL